MWELQVMDFSTSGEIMSFLRYVLISKRGISVTLHSQIANGLSVYFLMEKGSGALAYIPPTPFSSIHSLPTFYVEIIYGPFLRLPKNIQLQFLDILYYLDSPLPEKLVKSLVGCAIG
jgi:hypothetical protein